MAPRAAPAGGAPPPLYPAAPAPGRGPAVRLSAPQQPAPDSRPAPTRPERVAPDRVANEGSGLFGMGSGGGGGGLFGQSSVHMGALFGGAGEEGEAEAQDEIEIPDEEEATDPGRAAVDVEESTPPTASQRPAQAAPKAGQGRPGGPSGPRPPQHNPAYPGYPAPQSPPTGYSQPYGAPQQQYGPPQGAPSQQQQQQPHGYPPPQGYPPQGYPPGYGPPPPGYGYPAYPGYPPPGGYPFQQYPGYPPGYPQGPQPTPAGGIPISGPQHAPPHQQPQHAPDQASGPAPDLISMDDVYARKAPASPPPSTSSGRGCRLVVLDGLPEGTEFHLPAGKIYDIGRDKEADVKILSTSVSRRQARIDATGASPVLIDCGSANGTQVNGELVGRHPLREGDLIKMGKVLFRYQSA